MKPRERQLKQDELKLLLEEAFKIYPAMLSKQE